MHTRRLRNGQDARRLASAHALPQESSLCRQFRDGRWGAQHSAARSARGGVSHQAVSDKGVILSAVARRRTHSDMQRPLQRTLSDPPSPTARSSWTRSRASRAGTRVSCGSPGALWPEPSLSSDRPPPFGHRSRSSRRASCPPSVALLASWIGSGPLWSGPGSSCVASGAPSAGSGP